MPTAEGSLVRHCFWRSHWLKVIYRLRQWLWLVTFSRLLLQIGHLTLFCSRRRRILRRGIRRGCFRLGTEREERREALLSRIQRLYALSIAVALTGMAPTCRRVSSLDNHPGLGRALPDNLKIVF